MILHTVSGMNYQFSSTLYNTILSNYSRHVKPRESNADVVNINIDFDIKTVIDFEENLEFSRF